MPVRTVVVVGRSVPKKRSRSGGVSARVQIAEMQRARLLSAATLAVGELGWTGTTVAHITSHARISRRTFYDLFEGREDCLLAVLQDILERIAGEIKAAGLDGCDWADRVRGGLFVILSFFDREPGLARLCVVQASQGGPGVLEYREGVLARLAVILDEGRGGGVRSRECTVLTAEGLVGATFAIVHARLSTNNNKRRREPLTGLLGELMSLIVLPYQGPAAARSERDRSLPSLPQTAKHARGGENHGVFDPLRDVPMRLTYRTARVLDGVATHPGASNRTIGETADIYDQGQISKLLSRLERLGLLTNTGDGQAKGEPNAWTLTPKGWQVTNSITGHTPGAHTHADGESA